MSVRKYSLVLATSVLLVASISLSSTSRAAQLVSSAGGCADIQQSDTNDGTPMILFHCHGTPNENWVLSGGTLSGENGVCLDILGSVPKDGAQVIVVQCNGRPSQKWQVIVGQIIGLGGKCLDLQGGSTADRTPPVIATCVPSSQSQQWSLQ
jgi:ricin-type beta-trefoil lectin protein